MEVNILEKEQKKKNKSPENLAFQEFVWLLPSREAICHFVDV